MVLTNSTGDQLMIVSKPNLEVRPSARCVKVQRWCSMTLIASYMAKPAHLGFLIRSCHPRQCQASTLLLYITNTSQLILLLFNE